jgi:hypothetical protein
MEVTMRKKNTKSRDPHGPCCHGIKQRIQSAKSETQMLGLIKTGNAYDSASQQTKNVWLRVAKERLATLKVKGAVHAS